jgi:hypothetical protein
MADIRVIIDGKLADLPPQGLNLPLTYSLKSRDGLTINTGSRSEYAFELPATKQNDDIFNRFWDVGGITINEQVFLDASIEVDGQPFFIGKCQLQSVTLRADLYSWQGKAYKVAFYGNNSDWAIRLKTTYLYQLDFGSHLYERDAIIAAWDYTYSTDFYKYILIKWRDWDVFGQADALESTPALFVRHILEKIFASIGYTIASNLITTDWFSKLVLPIPITDRINDTQYGIEYLNISAHYLWNPPINIIEYPFVFPFQTVAPTIGANPYDPLTGIYTAPADGFYQINLKAIFTNVAGSVDPSFFYGLNGEWTTFPPTWTYIEQPNITTDAILNYSFVLNLTQGDTLAMGLSFGLGSAAFELDFYYDIVGEAEISNNINLDFKYLINKSWSALDFIKGLAHAFNLVFETDEGARSVRIDPADRYLLEDRAFPLPNVREFKTGFYYRNDNLTKKVDLLKGGELVSDTKMDSSITLMWQADSNDPTVEAMNQGQNVGLLSARYNFQQNRFSTNPNVIENPFFAPTVTIVDNEIKATGSPKDVIIPIIWSTNYLETPTSTEKNIDVLPRLLISEQLISGYNGTINVKSSTGVIVEEAPLAYMVDYNDTAGYQTSLSFSDDTVNGFNISGLMKRFYLPELVRWQNGKQLEIYMYWDIVMIQNLTFRHRVIINSDTYILQEVNTFDVSKSGSTKTYLIQDFKEVDAEDRIQNTQIQSKVNI